MTDERSASGGIEYVIGRLGVMAGRVAAIACLGSSIAGCSIEVDDGSSLTLGDANSKQVESDDTRRLEVVYEVDIPRGQSSEEAVQLFLPIASDTTAQQIHDVRIESKVEGSFGEEAIYGNRFWHAEVPAEAVGGLSIRVVYDVERRVLRAGDDLGEREDAERFLGSNERVVVGHPILDPILEEIRARTNGGNPSEKARAIYDWVVDNVEYKKVGTGWGNGDTFWACTERYGNCTDFHSLFISLARTEGIPARFEMGFPIPEDRSEGEVRGYHCWVEFWLPDEGWFPVDASEAFKHPEMRDLLYGTHPADRLHFTTGRDLRLGSAHRDRSLNYFIYPYAEIDGRRSELEIQTRLRYRDKARDQALRPSGDQAVSTGS